MERDDLSEEPWRKLREERDPWRVVAIGSEAVAWWIYVRVHPHGAAELVMATHARCNELNANIATLWLHGLAGTSLWSRLLTQSFFRSWLSEHAASLLPVAEEQSVMDCLSADSQNVPVVAQSVADFREACVLVLNDLRLWEAEPGRLDRNVGGFNVMQALNMSRWRSRQHSEEPSQIFNAAAFGLEFVPNSTERYQNSFLKEVLDGKVIVHSITLGTPPDSRPPDGDSR